MANKSAVASLEETAEDRIQRAKSFTGHALISVRQLGGHLDDIRNYAELTTRYEINDSCDHCDKHEAHSVDMTRIQSMLTEAFEELRNATEDLETLHFADIHM